MLDASLVFLPEPPENVRARGLTDGSILVAWDTLPGGAADHYAVYRSADGYGFGNPRKVASGASVQFAATDLDPRKPWFFYVTAINAGGESRPSVTVGACAGAGSRGRVLVVNGFDRVDRFLSARQDIG